MVSFIGKLHLHETQFYQPNFGRSRQALRSPMKSESLSLEAALMTYDITKLYERTDAMQTALDADFNIMNNGDLTSYSMVVNGGATTSTIPSLESITTVLKGFNTRLEILEKGLH